MNFPTQTGCVPAAGGVPRYYASSTVQIRMTFCAVDGSPLVPSVARYRLDDVKSGESVIGWTALEALASSVTLTIAPSSNLMRSSQSVDRRRLTVTAEYASGATDAATYDYFCARLTGIDGGSP